MSEISSKIDANQVDLLNQAFTEEVDETLLRRCITYLIQENKFERCGNTINQGINPAVYFAYLRNVRDGKVNILYKRGGGDRYGLYRRYASVPNCNSCGACHFMREIRAALYKDTYIDLDIVNAYPNFMFAITNGPYLGEYINNRDACIAEVMNSCHVSRDKAKQLFLMIGFGGNYETWYSENARGVCPSKFVLNYYNEMQQSRQTIVKYFSKFKYPVDCVIKGGKYLKSDGKTHNSHLDCITAADTRSTGKTNQYDVDNGSISRCMQFLEVNIIRAVYKKLQDIGIDVSTCIYCFDGCMVKKSELEKVGYTADRLCEAVNQYIQSLDFYIPLNNIVFVSKDFEQNNFDPMKYDPTEYDTYEEYIADMPEMLEFPDEDFSWTTLEKLKQGDRNDRQIEYLNTYCVYDMNRNEYILRISKTPKDGQPHVIAYSPDKFKYNLSIVGCKQLIDSVQHATRFDDIERPRKWLIRDKDGNLFYNMFMGIDPAVRDGEYNPEIGKEFEEFVNTFALGESIHEEEQLKAIEPLKRIIGSLACRAGVRLEIMVCIVSIQGFGKDTLFDIISKWYDSSEVAKSSPERLFGNFNTDAGKCLVLLDECHDRGNTIVNAVKNYVTTSTVTVNHKYGNIETKTNKSTLFLFGNSTQGIPVEWETADRRALFYNLQNVSLKCSKAKTFMTKWSKDPAFLSSCYHKACEWYDPEYDFHRNISTVSKDNMQSVNMPFLVEAIYYNRLFESYTPTEFIEKLKLCYDGDIPSSLSVRTIRREINRQLGNNFATRSNGANLINLYKAKELIEEKYRIKKEDQVECEL